MAELFVSKHWVPWSTGRQAGSQYLVRGHLFPFTHLLPSSVEDRLQWDRFRRLPQMTRSLPTSTNGPRSRMTPCSGDSTALECLQEHSSGTEHSWFSDSQQRHLVAALHCLGLKMKCSPDIPVNQHTRTWVVALSLETHVKVSLDIGER